MSANFPGDMITFKKMSGPTISIKATAIVMVSDLLDMSMLIEPKAVIGSNVHYVLGTQEYKFETSERRLDILGKLEDCLKSGAK